jgi:glycosyltransferase involved in cell wall biosynthesis
MAMTLDHDQPAPTNAPTTARGAKIVYLGAGAGGMYCGACLHDNTLAAAMLQLGAEVLFVPTYTPIRTDEADVSQQRVLFGGINVYLQERLPLFRYTPWFVDRLFDSPRLLQWLSRLEFSVQAEKLGRLTVSTLRGEHGHQRKELEKIVQWLETEIRPDVVHLSNAILAGFAREISDRLGVPVVCTLAGEDVFLDKLRPPYREQARAELRQRVQDISAFVALNAYYADYMVDYAGIDRQKIHVIPHGLKLTGHAPRIRPADAPPTLGFLARICSDKGLHQLVEAFRILAADGDLPGLRLKAAGYLGPADRPYLQQIQSQLQSWGLAERFEYAGELSRDEKIAFLQSLDVMSVPTTYRESKGLSILEALANAVPVVLPAHGTFPELVADTGGGLLSTPGSAADLAQKIKQLLSDPAQASAMGLSGHRAVVERYNDRVMAQRTLGVYEQILASGQRKLAGK